MTARSARSVGVRHRPGKDPAKTGVRQLEAQLERAKDRIGTLEELVTAQGKCLALHVDVRVDDSATSPTP